MALGTPTTDTAPIAGSTAGEYSFAAPGINLFCIQNRDVGVPVYVKTYDDATQRTAQGPASETDHDFVVLNGEYRYGYTIDLSGGGKQEKFSVYVPTGGTVGNLTVKGNNG